MPKRKPLPNPGKRKRRRNDVPNLGQREVEVTWSPKSLRKRTNKIRGLTEAIYDKTIEMAIEIQEVRKDIGEDEFWSKAVPLALYTVIERFDSVSSYQAASSFIEHVYSFDDDE